MKETASPRTSRCPACRSGYYLNRGEIGHRTVCQKCGQKFHLLPPSHETPTVVEAPPEAQRESWPLVGRLWLDLRPGQIIIRRYLVLKALGQGGLSQVFQVRDMSRNIELALKLPLAATLDRLPPEVFVGEAAAWLVPAPHPNLVTCDHVMVFMKQPIIFMEYVSGTDLWHLVDEGRGGLYRAAPKDVQVRLLDIFIQVARGLAYAHSLGLSHLDIKPRNILVEDGGRALIGDYGPLSQPGSADGTSRREGGRPSSAADDTRLSRSRLLGTPQYYSPEVSSGQPGSGVGSDLWALALTALECFIGRRPWEVGSLAGRALEGYLADPSMKIPVSGSLAAFFRRALAEKPGLRQSSAVEVETELIQIYEEISGRLYDRARPEPSVERADRLNNKAISRMELGQYDQAVELWDQALARDPGHKPSLHNKELAAQWRRNCAPDVTRPVIPKWWLGRRLQPAAEAEPERNTHVRH